MGDLDKLIVAKGFKKGTKVQLISQSGHTASSHESQHLTSVAVARGTHSVRALTRL